MRTETPLLQPLSTDALFCFSDMSGKKKYISFTLIATLSIQKVPFAALVSQRTSGIHRENHPWGAGASPAAQGWPRQVRNLIRNPLFSVC